MSGVPGNDLTLVLYRNPRRHSSLRSANSGLVFRDLIADMILCVISCDRPTFNPTLQYISLDFRR